MKFFIIYVKSFQSIYDLAVQQYGSVDHVDTLLADNPTIDLDNDLAVGTAINIRQEISVLDEATKKFFTDSKTELATWENDGVSPGYDPGFSSCPVANVNAKNTDDEILATGTFASGGSGSLIIPDVEVIVNGESQGNKVVKSPIIIIPTLIQYIRPANSGVGTTSYLTGDEGSNQVNYPAPVAPVFGVPALLDPTDPKKLLNNNFFGHKQRFTGIHGGYWDYATLQYKLADGTVSDEATTFGTSASNTSYLIDNHTGAAYKWSVNGSAIWSTQVSNILGLTHNTFSDYFLHSRNQILSVVAAINLGTNLMTIKPFNSGGSLKTSTPQFGSETTSHHQLSGFAMNISRADGIADNAFPMRWHF